MKILEISEGSGGEGGGKIWGLILENPAGRGWVIWQIPSVGMVWIFQIHMFGLIDRCLCLTYRTHAMNYFASLGIFMCHGCRMQR